MQDNSKNSGGIGFVGMLQILFIGLKLTGYIDWSWYWVLSPLIISTILGLLILIIIFIFAIWRGLR